MDQKCITLKAERNYNLACDQKFRKQIEWTKSIGFLPNNEVVTNSMGNFKESSSHRIHSKYGLCHLNPYKVNDNHMEELYQATPEELKENRRLLQVQGDDSYLTTVAFMDRALKKAQVRTELRIHY